MKRILVLVLILLSLGWTAVPLAAAELPSDPVPIDAQSITEVIALVMALIRGGCSVAIVVSLTLIIVQLSKKLLKKRLPESVPVKVVAVGIGAALTAVALFVFHSIDGSPPVVFTEVILAILGAPTVFEVLKGK